MHLQEGTAIVYYWLPDSLRQMLTVYFDNVIDSGRTRGDLEPKEMRAVEFLKAEVAKGTLIDKTSRESWREQERTKDPTIRKILENARDHNKIVQDDHRVLGFQRQDDQCGGFIVNPIVTDVVDERLFNRLREIMFPGTKPLKWDDRSDIIHLANAVCNHCDIFLTLDPHFLNRRKDLESMCEGLRILTPSELQEDLLQG